MASAPGTLLTEAAWPLALVLPVLLAVLMLPRLTRSFALALAPLAALPALGLGMFGGTGAGSGADLPWALLGMRLGLSETTRVFMIFTATLWLVAGVYARTYMRPDANRVRFFAFFLVTLTGNLGLIMARDLASFYLFFTLMSFAAYGLIIHDATPRARRAARVYLILVVLGEAFILPAVLMTAATATNNLDNLAPSLAASPLRDWIVACALIGFGVKAGALPVHLWLPLAHPAAPTPASAVLSGSMIKAGLLGWLLFVPAGEATLPTFGTVAIVAGLAAVFYGVLVGISQSEPKSILAYSSISQMGLMTLALGVGMAAPAAWPAAIVAILVYATHHALAKGALFLGVGVADKAAGSGRSARLFALGGLALAALVIAGAPLTSGALAKEFLKGATDIAPAPWNALLEPLIQAGAVGSTLIMLRFLYSIYCGFGPAPGAEKRLPAGLVLPWSVVLGGMFALLFVLPAPPAGLGYALLSFSALWPTALGVALFFGALWLGRRTRLRYPSIPEGDLLIPATSGISAVEAAGRRVGGALLSGYGALSGRARRRLSGTSGEIGTLAVLTELSLRRWTVAGGVVVALVGAMFALVVALV